MTSARIRIRNNSVFTKEIRIRLFFACFLCNLLPQRQMLLLQFPPLPVQFREALVGAEHFFGVEGDTPRREAAQRLTRGIHVQTEPGKLRGGFEQLLFLAIQ